LHLKWCLRKNNKRPIFIFELKAECSYAECHYAECHYTECHGTQQIRFYVRLALAYALSYRTNYDCKKIYGSSPGSIKLASEMVFEEKQ
jgi:hypothetical protein